MAAKQHNISKNDKDLPEVKSLLKICLKSVAKKFRDIPAESVKTLPLTIQEQLAAGIGPIGLLKFDTVLSENCVETKGLWQSFLNQTKVPNDQDELYALYAGDCREGRPVPPNGWDRYKQTFQCDSVRTPKQLFVEWLMNKRVIKTLTRTNQSSAALSYSFSDIKPHLSALHRLTLDGDVCNVLLKDKQAMSSLCENVHYLMIMCVVEKNVGVVTDFIQQMVAKGKVKHVTLMHCMMNAEHADLIEPVLKACGGLTNNDSPQRGITSLALWRCYAGTFVALAKLLPKLNLESLSISEGGVQKIPDATHQTLARAIASAIKNGRLLELGFIDIPILDGYTLKDVISKYPKEDEIIPESKLENLEISTDTGRGYQERKPKLTIQTDDSCGEGCSLRSGRVLRAGTPVLHTGSLTSLYLLQSGIEDPGFEAVSSLISRSPHLRYFSTDSLNESDMHSILQCLQNRDSLETLRLDYCQLTGENANALSDVIRSCSNLKQLYLRHCRTPPEFFASEDLRSALVDHTSLIDLLITSCFLPVRVHLIQLLQHVIPERCNQGKTKLRHVAICNCHVRVDNILDLADSLAEAADKIDDYVLESLNIDGNGFGRRHLTELNEAFEDVVKTLYADVYDPF